VEIGVASSREKTKSRTRVSKEYARGQWLKAPGGAVEVDEAPSRVNEG